MSRGLRSWVLVLLVAGLFFWVAIGLFNRQFASGEAYPEYSSMRTDRMGAKLLYESLGRLPGVTVERNFMPFAFLPASGVTLVLLATNPETVNGDPMFLKQVEQIAGRGNRVVAAMRVDLDYPPKKEDFEVKKDSAKKGEPPPDSPLHALWKVKFAVDETKDNGHPLNFSETEGWTVRDKVGSKVLGIERAFGKGSVVLIAESFDFSNESIVRMKSLGKVSGALGAYPRIIFDEEHLGIAESGSVVSMARRFRLTGLALGLAMCAALFIWKNASGFPPQVPAPPGERFSGRTSHAGLLTLLKRHIPSKDLAGVCWHEWLGANRHQVTPERQKEAEAAVARSTGRPLEATREIQAVLHAKGEL